MVKSRIAASAVMLFAMVLQASPAAASIHSCQFSNSAGNSANFQPGAPVLVNITISLFTSPHDASAPVHVVATGKSPDPQQFPSISSTTLRELFQLHDGETISFTADVGPAPETPGFYQGLVKFVWGGVCKSGGLSSTTVDITVS